jgi:hypothetical protein
MVGGSERIDEWLEGGIGNEGVIVILYYQNESDGDIVEFYVIFGSPRVLE